MGQIPELSLDRALKRPVAGSNGNGNSGQGQENGAANHDEESAVVEAEEAVGSVPELPKAWRTRPRRLSTYESDDGMDPDD